MNLAELIDTHRGGRSYPELSRACGGSPSDKRLQQLVRSGREVRSDLELVLRSPVVEAIGVVHPGRACRAEVREEIAKATPKIAAEVAKEVMASPVISRLDVTVREALRDVVDKAAHRKEDRR